MRFVLDSDELLMVMGPFRFRAAEKEYERMYAEFQAEMQENEMEDS
jgi:hypothetical protein